MVLVESEDPAELAVQVALVESEDPVEPAVLGLETGPAAELELGIVQVAEPELEIDPVVEPELVIDQVEAELELVPVAAQLARIKSVTAAHRPDLVPLLVAEEDLVAVVAVTMREPAATEAVIAWEVAE